MATCEYCGAETALYDSAVPVCIKCVDDPKARRNPLIILTQNLTETTKRFEVAREAFSATMADVPSGLPHPDGVQRIRNVSRALDAAGKDLTKAQALVHAFLTQGIIPEDLELESGES